MKKIHYTKDVILKAVFLILLLPLEQKRHKVKVGMEAVKSVEYPLTPLIRGKTLISKTCGYQKDALFLADKLSALEMIA